MRVFFLVYWHRFERGFTRLERGVYQTRTYLYTYSIVKMQFRLRFILNKPQSGLPAAGEWRMANATCYQHSMMLQCYLYII
jgi:hypothetical protein